MDSQEQKNNTNYIPAEMYKSELSKIVSEPVKYITDWADDNLMHVGKKVFKIVALMPCSLIIPDITFKSKDIKSKINLFILGPPASGKSSICEKFNELSYFGFSVKGISAKKLLSKISDAKGFFSVSIDDFSNKLNQQDGYETIKILEGALGDERKASHENMNYSSQTDTNAVGLICGTWSDLRKYHSYLRGGLLSRMGLLFISLTQKQREEIADFIDNGIGKKQEANDSKIKEFIIKDYYKLLFQIQGGRNTEIQQVTGYEFDEKYKKMGLNHWKTLTRDFANDINGDFKRELHDFYRYTISHAFLNVFNRKVVNGILIPTREDYLYALDLLNITLGNKVALLQGNSYNREITSPEILLKVLMDPRLKEDAKNILMNLSPHSYKIAGQLKDGLKT